MKPLLLLSLAFLTSGIANAQFGDQVVISTSTLRPYLAIPFDIDNDGILDILAASGEDRLNWYKGMDGLGNFDQATTIVNSPTLYLSIDFVDLDTDGDKDFLLLENNPRKITWLENLDGEGNFSVKQTLFTAQPNFFRQVNAVDLDLDGDLDLVVSVTDTFSEWVVWYENLNGQAIFSAPVRLIENITQLSGPLLVDIDNDGLTDLLTANENNGPANIVWYKNLGNVEFSAAQEIFQYDFRLSDWTSVYNLMYLDVNSDGKKDIALTSTLENFGTHIEWFENLDNTGNFGSVNNIADLMREYEFCDLDNDGDLDLLLWARQTDILSWMRNDGQGNFSNEQIISNEVDFPSFATAADLNGDGFLDVISASIADDKIAWYPNQILGIMDQKLDRYVAYPNPTKDFIQFNPALSIKSLEIYNLLGQKMPGVYEFGKIDLSTFSNGIYFVNVIGDSGQKEVFRILKE